MCLFEWKVVYHQLNNKLAFFLRNTHSEEDVVHTLGNSGGSLQLTLPLVHLSRPIASSQDSPNFDNGGGFWLLSTGISETDLDPKIKWMWRHRNDIWVRFGPVGWGYRIHRLLLCKGVRLPQQVSWYDTKNFDGEFPVMLELWIMQSTPSLPLLPVQLWSRVVAPDRVLSMD